MLRSGGDSDCTSTCTTSSQSQHSISPLLGPEGDTPLTHMHASGEDEAVQTEEDCNKFKKSESGSSGDDDQVWQKPSQVDPQKFQLDPALLSRNDLKVCDVRGSIYRVEWSNKGVTQKCIAKVCRNAVELEMLSRSEESDCLVVLLTSLLLSLNSPPPHTLLLLDPCLQDLQQVFDNLPKGTGVSSEWVSWICLGLVKAMSYLHAKQVAHRSIRLKHIMLSHRGTIKLCGIGNSIHMTQKKCAAPLLNESSAEESLFWSPEMLGCQGVDYEPFPSDIYAMGVVMHLLLLAHFPWLPTLDPKKAIADRKRFKVNCSIKQYNTGATPLIHTIQQLLLPTPTLRPPALTILFSDWLTATKERGVPSSFLQTWNAK